MLGSGVVPLQKTRQAIVELLMRHGSATVDELARELGLVPVTVRSHLTILERDGFVTGQQERTGGAGRPHVVYRLTEQGQELFPRHYDRLANRLLDHLLAREGRERVVSMLETIASDVASEYAPEFARKPFEERVRESAAVLSEQGCTAEYRADDAGGHHVAIYNCPYRKVVSEHPDICTMEMQLLRSLTGGRVLPMAAPAPRGAICTYTVLPEGDPAAAGA